MKKLISVHIIALLVMLSIDILALSLTNSTVPNFSTAQIAYAIGIGLDQDEAVSRAKKLERLEVTERNFTLAPGKTKQLKYVKIPADASLFANSEWDTFNPKVATVDKNGKVTAKKPGVTTISFSTWGKNYSDSAQTPEILCYVSTTAPNAAAFTLNDIQFTSNNHKMDLSITLTKAKKLFPNGRIVKNEYMDTTNYYHKNIMFSFYTKSGKLNGIGARDAKTPRGIKIGSNMSDVIAKYGFPTYANGGSEVAGTGFMLTYEVNRAGLVFSTEYDSDFLKVSAVGLYVNNNN